MSLDQANHIGKEIFDMIKREIKKPDFSPTQALTGQMLAIMAYMRIAAVDDMPASFVIAMLAIKNCLDDIKRETEQIARRN